ncbi:hypothetical protein FB451DRAFT_1403237 [Mycena latifolia]|nr:hypothetical protein FB451DRAFT_1403237 [Mycena latifolia]
MPPLPHCHTNLVSASTPYIKAWLSGPQDTKFYTPMYKAESPTAAFLPSIVGAIAICTQPSPSISVFVFDLRQFGRTAMDKDNKSKDSAYGKTDAESQLDDMEWAIEHAEFGD